LLLIKVSLSIKDKYFFIDLSINKNTTIKELIVVCVENFNEKFKNEKMRKVLNFIYDNYNIKPAKKSGKPDEDIPCKYFIFYSYFIYFDIFYVYFY
jgi:hypothetical protein